MNLSQGIALSGIILAVVLLVTLKLLDSRVPSTLRKFLRLSGLVYLSSTVVMYLLIRYQPVLTPFYTILAESLALGIHIFSSLLLFFFSKKLTENVKRENQDSTQEKPGSSDIEAK